MSQTKKISLSALFLALGLVLPFITGQIPQIGSMLLPMHIPVLLCGLICGWQYGLLVGFITPLLRSAVFGMPVMYPMAVAMAFELAAYGLVSGWLYSHSKWQCLWALYKSLVAAMVAGRLVYGLVMVVIMGLQGSSYTFAAFISGTLVSGVPGILLQLVLIPAVMVALDKTGLVRFQKHNDLAQAHGH